MRLALPSHSITVIVALCAGAITIFGYAPFYVYPVPLVTLAILFYSLQQASTAKQATIVAYAFGLGFFCTGVSWIYVSLHDFGGMPWWFAGFATFVFCAFLALFTAAVGWLTFKTSRVLIAGPIFWVLLEWVRSWIFTGFPWLNVGYSQTPYGPLAGFAPVVGIYGVSLFVAFVASLLVLMANKPSRKPALLAFVVVWIGGSILKQVEWSRPVGEPLSVALVQGNVPQEMKWQPEVAQQTLDDYLALATQTSAKLIVLPEAALPLLLEQVPVDYLNRLKSHGVKNQSDILVGVLEAGGDEYFNSVLSYGNSPTQTYRKSHLVPFGEFIPLKAVFGWIYRDWLNMPISDLSRGGLDQKPMAISGQQVAVNICYEDVFGEEIIRQLPQATLLVNASNMAWFGNSWSADQHLQMSQTRALETGRMMLRATNTGSTAIIDTHGHVLEKLPHFVRGTLESTAQGYSGTTPYVRWGNWPAISFMFVSVVLLWGRKKK
ncbi:MAG TPA: apolipoprotein N-acyltransferase [Methylophilaceae bacterium]|nr:apolipoprotein N-acyltransferase [Methylophilaceae bacterium]